MAINSDTGISGNTKKVSATNFYAYKMMLRAIAVNHIVRCRQLFHQFVLDMYAKIESERLLFVCLNQKKLRVDDYIHLRDAVAGDGNTSNVGQLVIPPSLEAHSTCTNTRKTL